MMRNEHSMKLCTVCSASPSEKKRSSSASEDNPSIVPKEKAKRSESFCFLQLVTDGAFPPCPWHSETLASAADGIFKWIAQKSSHIWDEPVHYSEQTFFLSLSALVKFSHNVSSSILGGAACAPKNFGISAVHAVLYNQDSVWGFPSVPAVTSRTPPAALPLSMPRRDPPNVVLERETVFMRTHDKVIPVRRLVQ